MRVREILVASVVSVAIAAAPTQSAQAQAGTLSAICASGGVSQPCTGQWYTTPVSVSWGISGQVTQMGPGCQAGVFSNDDVTKLSCSVTWADMTTSSVAFVLHIEISVPSAAAGPDRPPDANGWYNHAVAIAFGGQAFSGIASCTPIQTYAGPNTSGTSIGGTCTDNAGKAASTSFPLRYDATPPSLGVAAEPADGSVGVSWHAAAGPAPLAWVQVSRSPGLSGAAASVLYQGGAGSYRDHRVRNETVYTYTVTAEDQAGNETQRVVTAKPGARLLAPAPGAHLSRPPTLRWTAIPKATYYNVQLFRGSKILSAWPERTSLRLARTWRFGGHRHRLAPGRYRWYVWPGFGPKRAAHYGHEVGNATFVVR